MSTWKLITFWRFCETSTTRWSSLQVTRCLDHSVGNKQNVLHHSKSLWLWLPLHKQFLFHDRLQCANIPDWLGSPTDTCFSYLKMCVSLFYYDFYTFIINPNIRASAVLTLRSFESKAMLVQYSEQQLLRKLSGFLWRPNPTEHNGP